jgi:hypothetical protein
VISLRVGEMQMGSLEYTDTQERASAVGEAESAVDCSRKRDEGKECI